MGATVVYAVRRPKSHYAASDCKQHALKTPLFSISALHRYEKSCSHLTALPSKKKGPSTHWAQGYVGRIWFIGH